MRRRAFIVGLGSAAAWPLAARAQQGERARRVGVLMGDAATNTQSQSWLAAFTQELRQLGWAGDRSLLMEVRWEAAEPGLARIYAAQLIGLMPDVILADTTLALTVVRQATSTVPVVFIRVSDPVAQGFVPSVRQPTGGNLTGFTSYEFSVGGKWLGLLKEAAPGLTRAAVVFNPEESPQSKFFLQSIEATAPSLGVQVIAMPLLTAAEIEPALASFARQSNGGLILPTGGFTFSRYSLIAEIASRFGLPSIAAQAGFARDGGLLEYGSTDDLTSTTAS